MTNRQQSLAFCVLALLPILPSETTAEAMRPLVDAMEESAAPYPFSRCGGLYQSMMEWIGEERMGQEQWSTTNQSRENMIVASAMISQSESGGTLESWIQPTVRDVRNIADLYLQRFERNYATIGQAFGEDALIQSDLSLCKSLVEATR